MTQRDRIVIGVFATVALIAGYWFVLLAPKREEAKDLSSQVAQQEQRRDEARGRIVAGETARRSYSKNYAAIARLGKAVPVDDQVPSLVYQLDAAADRTGIDFRSLRLSQSGGGGAAAPAPAPPAGEKGAGAAATAPATQEAAAVAPPGTSIGAAGFPTMPFAFSFDGDFFDMERFLSQIERFTQTAGEDVNVRGRLLTVDGFSLSAGADGFPSVKASIAATAYLLPPGEATADGTAPAAPNAAGTPPAGSGGAAAPAPTTATISGARP